MRVACLMAEDRLEGRSPRRPGRSSTKARAGVEGENFRDPQCATETPNRAPDFEATCLMTSSVCQFTLRERWGWIFGSVSPDPSRTLHWIAVLVDGRHSFD